MGRLCCNSLALYGSAETADMIDRALAGDFLKPDQAEAGAV